jgi:hypothetical protein
LTNQSIRFWQKISELLDSATKARMKVPRGNPRTKQVESSIKLATLAVTKVIIVKIVLKLNLSFIRLSWLIYVTWDPKMTLAL